MPKFSPASTTSSICTCQYPGVVTGAQTRSEAMLSRLYSPKVISLSSPSLPKKTAKRLRLSIPEAVRRSSTENVGPSAMSGKDKPRMPSKGTRLKGSSDSCVAATKLPCVQMLPMQMSSFTKTPLISPVPKVMVTTSRSPPFATALSGVSAKATSTALVERDASKRLCEVQASSEHCLEGSSRFPLPVSKTTSNSCGGEPIEIFP
mmetsp:Transcript_81289/g.174004  ORF Transcript_81289/g.174004 Transcript_81289/m.174004 type:complete len:205 (-) Transcript_81289:355-969(-)